MDEAAQALLAHLERGDSTVCRAWEVARVDGERLHFTDHDRDLTVLGQVFHANGGLEAAALIQGTGLSVDNTEAAGALSSDLIRESDIAAGRYDGAKVTCWLVNWARVEEHLVLFRGTLGEVTRVGAGFHAELRSLSEQLNTPRGRIYQAGCGAVLGDRQCGVDLSQPGYSTEVAVERVSDRRVFEFERLDGFADRWFERGRLKVLSGAAAGLQGVIKNDRLSGDGRRVELWQDLRAEIAEGDMLRLEAGCDKRSETCRLKFNNLHNFRGFPHIPGEDWLSAVPSNQPVHDGGQRLRWK